MYCPHRKILFLIMVLSIGLAASVIPLTSSAQNTSPQRLRVRVDNRKLKPGEEAKVVVEFLDMNYNQVVNDTKREIVLGQSSADSKQTGDGYIKPERIWVNQGEWSGSASFVSKHSGRLFITAESKGLESARTLVLITEQTASFLSQLFETVAYAQDDEPFAISPEGETRKANNKDFATFQVSFLKDPPAGTILKIYAKNLKDGQIKYKGEYKGSSIAEIRLDGETGVTDDIQISSLQRGPVDVEASVEGLFSAHAKILFEPPLPSKLLFDDVPKAIASDASEVCVTARLYDESTALVKADQDRMIRFKAARDAEKISFDPESVKITAGQDFAETRMKLMNLPSGNRISILASSPGIQSAEKAVSIESFIHKLLVTGPREVKRGQEVEFTIQLAKEDGSYCEADLDRTIDVTVDGGTLSKAQLIISRGQRRGSIRYTAPKDGGNYTLTAFSSDLEKSTFSIKVVTPSYLLILVSLLGSLVGGLARQLQKDGSFRRFSPQRIRRRLDLRLLGRLFGSLVGGLFFYLTLKFGLGQALSSPALPATLDFGSGAVAFFIGGIGGFTGIFVLDQLANWFMPFRKRRGDHKQPATPAVQ